MSSLYASRRIELSACATGYLPLYCSIGLGLVMVLVLRQSVLHVHVYLHFNVLLSLYNLIFLSLRFSSALFVPF